MWLYRKNEQSWGPLHASAIRGLLERKAITGDTLVCQVGTDEWEPLSVSSALSEPDSLKAVAEPTAVCAWSGELFPVSKMVQLEGLNVAVEHKDLAVEYIKQGGVLPRVKLTHVVKDVQEKMTGDIGFGHLFARSWRLMWSVMLPALVVSVPILVAQSFALDVFGHWLAAHFRGAGFPSPRDILENRLSFLAGVFAIQSVIGSLAHSCWLSTLQCSLEEGTFDARARHLRDVEELAEVSSS